jgi:hypothetical protein
MKQTLVAVLSVLLPLTALPDDGFRVSYGAVPYLKRLELRLRYTFPFKNKTLINQANQFLTSSCPRNFRNFSGRSVANLRRSEWHGSPLLSDREAGL